MRRTLSSFFLLLTVGLGLHAQILMPESDGGERTIAISSEQEFYDSGGKDGDIPKHRVTAITFTPRAGEFIEITFEEVDLKAGAGLYFYNGIAKLIKDTDDDGEDTYRRPRSTGAPFLSYPQDIATKVVRSKSLDGKLTVMFENGNGSGKGWVAKVTSSPRQAGDPKLPDDEVRIGATPQTITVGDKPLNFYDDGGKDGKITENFDGSITFVPKTTGKRVKITFNKLALFNTNPQRNDQLHIYNGKEAKADKLLRTLLKDKTPIILRSGSEDGALTVTLKSTTGVTRDGFEAVVEEFEPQDMSFTGFVQTQASSGKSVLAGSKKQEILNLTLQTKDNLKPLSVSALTFSSEGSTEGVLAHAELWTVGEGTLKPAVKVGEVTSPGKTFTITLTTPYTLAEGGNAFVLYYDLAETATTGGVIDAALTSAVIGGKTETAEQTEVAGNRPIKNEAVSAEGNHTYRVYGEWSFIPKLAFNNKYEGGNKDQITTFTPDKVGNIIEIDFKSFQIYYGKASIQPKAKFEVYAGSSVSGTPIWKADITNHNEGPKILRSTATDGALTIVFNPSETSSVYTDKGWTASVRSVTPKAMAVTKAEGFQASAEVTPVGAVKQALLGLELQTEGFLSPLTLDQLKVRLKGSEGYLKRIALYASKDKKEFNSSYLVAEASAPLTSEVTLTPTANKTLEVGANYYYLAFDLKDDAPAGVDIDASFGDLLISGNAQSITTPDPEGARRTSLQHIFVGGKDVTVEVSSPLLFYDAGGPSRKAPNATGTGSVHFKPRAGEIIRCTALQIDVKGSQKLQIYSGASTEEKDLIHQLKSGDELPASFISFAEDGSVTIKYTQGYGESEWEISVESIQPRALAITSVTTEAAEPKQLLRGQKDVPFVHVIVKVDGERQSTTITGLNLAALDATSKKALGKRSVYTTGMVGSFSSNDLFGSTEDAEATVITGSITYDRPGTYHYWLTGDIAGTAEIDSEVKMSLQSISVKDASPVAPATTTEGKHTIQRGKSGTFIIGTSSEASYKTVQEATEDLKKTGVDGPVTLLIDKGIYEGMVHIPEIEGLSSTNTLTIRSESGKREDVVFNIKGYTDKSNDLGHFTIDGADYVTLEGVTIKGDPNGKKAPAVLLIRNKSEHVTIRNCYIWAPEALDYSTGTLAGVRTKAENIANRNNDHFTLEGSTIEGGYHGVYVDGTGYVALPKQRGALIKGNTFIAQGTVGIYSTKVIDVVIDGNHVIGRGKVVSPYKPLDVALMGNTIIRNNKVEVQELVSASTPRDRRDINALYLRAGSVAENVEGRNLIYNNEVRINGDNGTSAAYGIYFADAHIGKADILHNSISITGAVSKKNMAALAILSRGTNVEQDVKVQNNLFQNHTGGYVFHLNRATMKDGVTFSHNANYTAGDKYAYLGKAMDQAEWQTTTGDATSIVEKAVFFDEASSLLPKTIGGLRFAPRLAEVTKDITDAERPDPATAGAYEVTEHTTPALETGYPRVDQIAVTTARLVVKANEFGKIFYKVLPASEATPSVDDLKASVTTLTFSKGTEQTKELTGLTSETEYKLYGLLLGMNDEYTEPFTPITFTTTYPATETSTFESVAVGQTTFDDGTAHFEGFEVVQDAKGGATAGSKHFAKIQSPADVKITNSRYDLTLDGFWLRSDKEVIIKAKDKDDKEGKSKTIPSTDGAWLYINLRDLGALHSLSFTTQGTAHIDDFSGAPAQLTLTATEETATSGEAKTLSVVATGGVAPYTYVWTDALGKEVSTEATYAVKADHTRLYKVRAKDAWGTETVAGKVLKVTGEAVLATFDDLALANESHWAGDPEQTEDIVTSTFYSGSYGFTNTYMKKSDAWGGYGYSNHTATTYNQLSDQYNGAVGHGAGGSKNYGVAYIHGDTKLYVTHAPKAVISGMYISNTAWVKHFSEHGTGMGDEPNAPFKKGDYYKITAISNDDETKKIDFYLADYRSDNPAEHYTIDTWQWLDLTPLGEVSSIRFTVAGTRANQFGSTIPFYFILDNVGGKIIEEQASTVTVRPGTTEALDLAKIFATSTLPKKAGAAVTYTLLEAPEATLATAVLKGDKLEVTTKVKGETSLLVQAVSRGATVYLRIPLTVGEPPVIDETVGITDLRVLPNPAVDYITLTTEGKVEIFSLVGECLYRNASYRRGERISVSDYAPGVYVVRAGGSNQRFIKK